MSGTAGKRHTKSPQNAPGYVYVVINPAWPGYCKLGLAKDLKNRLRQMNTNDPFRAYSFHTVRKFNDRKDAEKVMHTLAAGYRRKKTEWFNLHADDAARLLHAVLERS